MIQRLYYDDSLLLCFDAVVTAVKKEETGCRIALNRSAFYPTSGGQPHDTGWLKTDDGEMIPVADVTVDDEGEVWHWTPGPLEAGTLVHGSIDKERRLDHMEQHGGEHLLANAVWRLLQGVTIGLHTGKEDATIDVMLPDGRVHLTAEEIRLLEDDVNGHIRENVPVKCFFPDAEELITLPLRKPPTVCEHVRVVQFGDFEYCACGGTHPPFAGMIGMVKILSVTPAKGKARICFVCGKRAHQRMAENYEAAKAAAEMLSSGVDELPDAVVHLKEQLLEQEKQKKALGEQLSVLLARQAQEQAQLLPDGTRVVTLHLPAGDRKTLVNCASELIRDDNTAALCLMPVDKGGYAAIFARGKSVQADMGALMRASGCKGGGKPDFAQGSAPDAAVLSRALDALQTEQ